VQRLPEFKGLSSQLYIAVILITIIHKVQFVLRVTMFMPDDDDIPRDDLEDLIDLEYEAEMDLMRELEQVNPVNFYASN
jgi:hypothetical protein